MRLENQLFLKINKYNPLTTQIISLLLIIFGVITIFAWKQKEALSYSLILICFLALLALYAMRLIYIYQYWKDNKILFVSELSFIIIFFGLLISYFAISNLNWSGLYISIIALFSFCYLAVIYSVFKTFYLNHEEGVDHHDED